MTLYSLVSGYKTCGEATDCACRTARFREACCPCLQNCMFRRNILLVPAELHVSEKHSARACRTACFAEAYYLCLQNCTFQRSMLPVPAELHVSQKNTDCAYRTACFAETCFPCLQNSMFKRSNCVCLQKCMFRRNILNLPAELHVSEKHAARACRTACFAEAYYLCLQKLHVLQKHTARACRTSCFADAYCLQNCMFCRSIQLLPA